MGDLSVIFIGTENFDPLRFGEKRHGGGQGAGCLGGVFPCDRDSLDWFLARIHRCQDHRAASTDDDVSQEFGGQAAGSLWAACEDDEIMEPRRRDDFIAIVGALAFLPSRADVPRARR